MKYFKESISIILVTLGITKAIMEYRNYTLQNEYHIETIEICVKKYNECVIKTQSYEPRDVYSNICNDIQQLCKESREVCK